jgi:hypothetical protein
MNLPTIPASTIGAAFAGASGAAGSCLRLVRVDDSSVPTMLLHEGPGIA